MSMASGSENWVWISSDVAGKHSDGAVGLFLSRYCSVCIYMPFQAAYEIDLYR